MTFLLERWLHRLRRAVRRKEFERLLDEELRFHVEAEVAELVGRGVARVEAERRALSALGGTERWREEARATRFSTVAENLVRDARLALRSLARSPAYSVAVTATLALGIAAMSSMASVAYDIVFRPLPYRDPSRLVALYERNTPRARDRNVVSAQAVEAWRERSHTLDSVTALMPSSRTFVTAQGAERISGAEVTPSHFSLLGRAPMLGAGFSPTPSREVVLSHGFWANRLGADSAIIGKSIQLEGEAFTVVGVMPADFVPLRFGWMGEQEFWLPLVLTPQHRNWGRFLLVVARMRPAATVERVDRELAAIHKQLRAEGVIDEGWDAYALSLHEEIGGSVRAPFVALLVACGLLLALVLANTSLLALAHSRRRAGDRALRRVLGATRARLLTEQLVTTAILAGGAALSGVGLSLWAVPALVRLLPTNVPRLATVHVGAVAVTIATSVGLLAAIVIAWMTMRDRSGGALPARLQSQRLTNRSRTSWIVVGEAATAVVLSLLAGLTIRSYERLSRVDLGFEPSHLLAFRVGFDAPARSSEAAVAYSSDFLERLRVLPDVRAAGRTSVRPLHEGGTATAITPLGWGTRDLSAFPTADVRFVDTGYFRALELPAVRGRLFSVSERRGTPLRVVVNESLVKQLFPNERDVVGRSFNLILNGGVSPEIIGVVRDVRLSNARTEPRPTVYISIQQQTAGEEFDVLVRTTGDENDVVRRVREVVHEVSSTSPIYRVESMQQRVTQTMARERVTMQLLVFFAAAALLLVAVGLYGLYAGEVTARRHEIGVRMALGETSRNVIVSLVRRALVRTVGGVLIGVACGALASRLVRTVLYGVSAMDPVTYVSAALAVVLTAVLATLPPAIRASSVPPGEVLRGE